MRIVLKKRYGLFRVYCHKLIFKVYRYFSIWTKDFCNKKNFPPAPPPTRLYNVAYGG